MLKKSILALVYSVAAVAFAVDPGIIFYWTGGSGDWTDVKNWSLDTNGNKPADRYPGSDDTISNDIAYFTANANGVINVNTDVVLYRIYGAAVTEPLGTELLEFTSAGTHTIRCTSTENSGPDRPRFLAGRVIKFSNIAFKSKYLEFRGETHIGAGTDIESKLYIWDRDGHVYFEDGSDVSATVHIQANGAKITFNGGNYSGQCGSGSSGTTIYGGTIVFNGGTQYVHLVARNNSTVIINSNGMRLKDLTTDGTETVLLSGSYVSDVQLKKRQWLGDNADASVICRLNSFYAFDPFSEYSSPSYNLVSTLYATNDNYSGFAFADGSLLYGTGRLYVNRLRLRANADARSCLDGKIYIGKSIQFEDKGIMRFCNPAFGSFGDWGVATSHSNGSIYFGYDNRFDTTDAFDGCTGRNISLKYCRVPENAVLRVTGCGSLSWEPNARRRLKEVEVGEGSTFSNVVSFLDADKVTLNANSKMCVTAGKVSLSVREWDIDPSASVEVYVPSTYSDYAWPIADGANADTLSSGVDASVFRLTGAGAERYTLKTSQGVTYLRSGTEYQVPEDKKSSNFWIGGAESGNNMNNPENWLTNAVPPSGSNSTRLYFGGYENLDITNDIENRQYRSFIFLADCGPAVIRGNEILSASYGYFDNNGSSFVSLSPFPQTIAAPVKAKSSRISVVARTKSYIAFKSSIWANENFFVQGHVRIYDKVTVPRGFYFGSNADGMHPTLFEVMPGASLVVSNQFHFSDDYHQIWNKIGAFSVHGGGSVTFMKKDDTTKMGWMNTTSLNTENFINGEFDVRCPIVGAGTLAFFGTGTVHLASTLTTNQNAKVVLGDGLTFSSDGFSTVTAGCPDNLIALNVRSGTVTLLPGDNGWIYGPEAGVETTTTADERALTIDAGATLGISAGSGKISFADPISGWGTLLFAEGSSIRLAGDLNESAMGAWTSFASVGSVVGVPDVVGCKVRTVESEDGRVILQAKKFIGARVIVR